MFLIILCFFLPFTIFGQIVTTQIKVGDAIFEVEIMNTKTKIKKGLSEYQYLEPNKGILYLYAKKNFRPSFWMKNMKFSIDIIWIKNYEVIEITSNIPVPKMGQKDSELPHYYPNQSVDAVLEIGAGIAKNKNIKVGDHVEFF